jgi:hypothetical protein
VSQAPTAHGPYEREPCEPFIAADQRKVLLAQALQGVELGAWDRRILDWLAGHPDTSTFLVILGIVERAKATAEQASTAQVRVLDPGTPHLACIWQAHDGHGHQATGQLAGAPSKSEFAGWRYPGLHRGRQRCRQRAPGAGGPQGRRPQACAGRPAAAQSSQRRLVCDFCADQPATYRYPTRRAGMVRISNAVVVMPGGDWLACPACHLLVEAHQWDTLSAWANLSAEYGAVL